VWFLKKKRPRERDLFKDSNFLFKIKKCNHLKSSRSVRIEITYLTKGAKREKQKIADGRINERKKIVGTGAGC
jgi:hypothetical protein